MEKPKCRVCEHKHWSHEPHVFEDSTPEARPLPKPASETEGSLSKETGQVARNRRYREKHREKYNAYMREYRRRKG
jgi:hypothetical protein